jgi:hypothetical protein
MDSVTRFFASGFFHESSSPKVLKIKLGTFKIFRKFAKIFARHGAPPVSKHTPPPPRGKFATGVNDTSGKFATGIINTNGKYSTGVNGTGRSTDQLGNRVVVRGSVTACPRGLAPFYSRFPDRYLKTT